MEISTEDISGTVTNNDIVRRIGDSVFGEYEDDIFGSLLIGVDDIVSNFNKESSSVMVSTINDLKLKIDSSMENIKKIFRSYRQGSTGEKLRVDNETDMKNIVISQSSVEDLIAESVATAQNEIFNYIVTTLDHRLASSRTSLLQHKNKILEKLEIVRRYATEERRMYDIESRNRELESMRIFKAEVTEKHNDYINTLNEERDVVIKIRAEKLANDLSIYYKDEINSLRSTIKDLEEKLEVRARIEREC